MKKITFLVLLFCIAVVNSFAQWQSIDRTKVGGGEIPEKVNFMAIANGKLYAATSDGIWESASMKGGDWVAFGLQGEDVRIINFNGYKLAMLNTPSSEDPEKTAGQLYKHNGTNWELTAFNAEKKSGFMPTTGFAQIKDDAQKQIIVIPTWGQNIWRSEDGGATWSDSPQLIDADFPNPDAPICKNTIGLFTFENDPVIYGTDKASAGDHYLVRSKDFGKTWEYNWIGNVFNPWSFFKRNYNGVPTFYFGGEKGQDGYTVMKSTDDGSTWDLCSTTDAAGTYWHNRCMVGTDNGPLYVMCSQTNVFVSKDDGKTLEPLGTGLVITEPSARSLTHMVLSDQYLYCSSQKNGIQFFDISSIGSGLNESEVNNLSIYPKLATDYIFVPSDINSMISIYNLQGVIVVEQISNNAQTKVAVSGLSQGLYIVKYKKNGIITSEKIIKQ